MVKLWVVSFEYTFNGPCSAKIALIAFIGNYWKLGTLGNILCEKLSDVIRKLKYKLIITIF